MVIAFISRKPNSGNRTVKKYYTFQPLSRSNYNTIEQFKSSITVFLIISAWRPFFIISYFTELPVCNGITEKLPKTDKPKSKGQK